MNISIKERKIFTENDFITMANFPEMYAMFDKIFYGEVKDVFESHFGRIRNRTEIMIQIRDDNRYMIDNYQSVTIPWIGVGVYFFDDIFSAPPEAGIIWEMPPGCQRKPEITAIMEEVSENRPEWTSFRLDQPESWNGMSRSKPLRSLMDGEDHVKNVREYIIEVMEDAAAIRNKYSNLFNKIR